MTFIQEHSRKGFLSTTTHNLKMKLLCLCVMLCLGVHESYSEILHRQKRNWIIDSFSIDEGYKGMFPYSLGKIDVVNEFTLFKIEGQGVDEEPKGILKINEYTGEITVHGPVDYEKYPVFKLKFQAYDSKKNILDTHLGIEIRIQDRNDNPPKFDAKWYEISIRESTEQGTGLITLKARDYDTDMNGKFNFAIVSVTPTPHDLEFGLTTNSISQTATIKFKGCLDHEKAEKYTVIVEAKDQGEDIQLSSSCTVIINIEDGNNHPPEITGQTGSGQVKEGEENVLVSRLQVTDKDTAGTAAWRAKYQIHGEASNYFRITTDPETNEGLLYVEKNLDYEDSPQKNVTITVENEIPYHSCKVISRSGTDLWEIVTRTGATGAGGTSGTGATIGGMTEKGTITQSTYTVTVTVEDVNEPPIFDKPNQQVSLGENLEEGQYLVTFTAQDKDISAEKPFIYTVGEDAAGWITVDSLTGKVTTLKPIDRESPFVKDNIYVVKIYATDDGKPPMTGTATLSIHISDENDNTPTLSVSILDMCQSDGPSMANITVSDLDEEPYGGPFSFKLLGDVEGRWRVEPRHGFSVSLVKENTVHSGEFKLSLEVSDLQHKTSVHNLSVTVCDCLNTVRPNCHLRKASGSKIGVGALGIVFSSILLLAGMLLLVFLLSCKNKKMEIPKCPEQHLIICNTEEPGNDCKVAFKSLNQEHIKTIQQQIQETAQVPAMTLKQATGASSTMRTGHQDSNFLYKATGASSTMRTSHQDSNFLYKATGASSTMRTSHQDSNFLYKLITDSEYGQSQKEHRRFKNEEMKCMNYMKTQNSMATGTSSTLGTGHQNLNFKYKNSTLGCGYSEINGIVVRRELLFKVLNMMLGKLQAPGVELGDYDPHVYAEEGDQETSYELEAIFNPDDSFDPDFDPDLYSKFSTLALICMPCESTAYTAETSCVMEKFETTTLIQAESQETYVGFQSHF